MYSPAREKCVNSASLVKRGGLTCVFHPGSSLFCAHFAKKGLQITNCVVILKWGFICPCLFLAYSMLTELVRTGDCMLSRHLYSSLPGSLFPRFHGKGLHLGLTSAAGSAILYAEADTREGVVPISELVVSKTSASICEEKRLLLFLTFFVRIYFSPVFFQSVFFRGFLEIRQHFVRQILEKMSVLRIDFAEQVCYPTFGSRYQRGGRPFWGTRPLDDVGFYFCCGTVVGSLPYGSRIFYQYHMKVICFSGSLSPRR